MLKIVYVHLYNICVSLLLKCGLDWSRRRYFISENKATCSLIATGLIFYDLRLQWYDTGSWNPSSNQTRTCLFYIVNIMDDDVMAT